MLKYKPKQFWGLLKRRTDSNQLDPARFAAFNQGLFHNPEAEEFAFTPLADAPRQWITVDELSEVLRDHFRADKSSGNSDLPLQLLKHLAAPARDSLTHLLNDSVIAQLAPQHWRDSKVTPIYKGAGDPADMNNYRSIAVTPPFTKLFMSIMNQRLTMIAEEEEMHAPQQAGFRRHHTTLE